MVGVGVVMEPEPVVAEVPEENDTEEPVVYLFRRWRTGSVRDRYVHPPVL